MDQDTYSVLQDAIEDLLQTDANLSAWEIDFLQDILGKIEYGLTEKQIDKCTEILDQHE